MNKIKVKMDKNTTEEANKELCKANAEQLFKEVVTKSLTKE